MSRSFVKETTCFLTQKTEPQDPEFLRGAEVTWEMDHSDSPVKRGESLVLFGRATQRSGTSYQMRQDREVETLP